MYTRIKTNGMPYTNLARNGMYHKQAKILKNSSLIPSFSMLYVGKSWNAGNGTGNEPHVSIYLVESSMHLITEEDIELREEVL